MGELILAKPSASVQLSFTLEDRDATKFPQALVYDSSDALLAAVALAHVADGRYSGAFVAPAVSGVLTAHYTSYTDAPGGTVDVTHGTGQDRIIVDDVAADVWDQALSAAVVPGSFGEAMRVLMGSTGKANYRLDNMVYDANCFLTSARLRVFADSGAAGASTAGGVGEGELYTINISGVPDGTLINLPSTVLGLF